MDTLDLLEKAFARLGPNGEHWTQESMARTIKNRKCRATYSRATSWCSAGSILATKDPNKQEGLDFLKTCLPRNYYGMIHYWNDDCSWSKVKKVWETAIQKAKALKQKDLG